MEILKDDVIQTMTGCKQRKGQIDWFKDRGITYQCDSKGNVWTTDDWLNGKDKYQVAQNDDGFDLGALSRAS